MAAAILHFYGIEIVIDHVWNIDFLVYLSRSLREEGLFFILKVLGDTRVTIGLTLIIICLLSMLSDSGKRAITYTNRRG